jgi:beta-lactamase class A
MMHCFRLLLFLLCTGAPLAVGGAVCDLDQGEDELLQQRLVKLVEELGLMSATRRGALAISLLVLTDLDHPRLAQVNGHSMLYAASLPKIAILLGAAVAIEEGRLTPDPALRADIENMIRHSCNACANRVLAEVGREALLEILQSPRYALYDPLRGGGLWVGKEYARNPAYQRDPLNGLSHGATTFQVARFYCHLHRGTLVSPEQDRMMLQALSRPGIEHKFVKGLSSVEGLELYRKSGTWRSFHADSVLVRSGEHAYVLAALADDPEGETWLERLAQPLHDLAMAPPGGTPP